MEQEEDTDVKIKLDDKHYLCSDKYNYWMTTECTSKEGKVFERTTQCYCKSIEDLLEATLRRKIGESEAQTLKELSGDIESAIKWMREVVGNLELGGLKDGCEQVSEFSNEDL